MRRGVASLCALALALVGGGCADVLGVTDIPPGPEADGGGADGSVPSDSAADGTTPPTDTGASDSAVAVDGTGTPSDAGADAIAHADADAAVADAGSPPDGALDAGLVPPTGTLLYPSSAVAIDGVTRDDYVIFTDYSAAPTVYALSLQPSSNAITLGPVDDANDVIVSGTVVLIGTNRDASGVGPLRVWTTASGNTPAVQISTASATFSLLSYAVSADGSEVLFLDAVSGGRASLVVGGTDGSWRSRLETDVDVSNTFCYPYLGFDGEQAVATYCVEPVDAGVPDGGTFGTLAVLTGSPGADAGPWTRTNLLVAGAQSSILVDPQLSRVIMVGPAGTVAFPVDGGARVTIDALGEPGAVTNSPGVLAGDGGTLLYTSSAQALRRAATTTPPSPVQLETSGSFFDVFALSPDQGWVVGALSLGPNGTDLYAASTTVVGSMSTLSSLTSCAIQGDAFTADSSHVLFFSGLDAQQTGTFNVAAVGGGTPQVLGTGGTLALATSGAKVIFDANLVTTTYSADLLAVDTSSAAAPTVLVSGASGFFALNAGKTALLYTWTLQSGTSSGLWMLPVP